MTTDRGTTLGKYRLIAEIARGGMGIVYLAMAQGPGGFHKLLVVKELKPELVQQPTFLAMFLDEARLAARLSHPNIVQTNEVGADGDRYFLAMEYLDGRSLDHVRRRAKANGTGLSLPMQLRVLCDMLGALDYAHHVTDFDGSPLAIVHRDVSPQNVFLTFDGQVKLLDFGIAKTTDSTQETSVGVLKGKVAYMSPEQARGHKVDARADVFSAGIMLWEALTGQRLREGKNDQERLWALVANDLPRASTVKPWVDPELDEICARAMAWDRDARFQSAGELQVALERYLGALGAVSSRDVSVYMAELFRDDRARSTAVIEAHVARVRSGAQRDEVPIIDAAGRGVGGGTPSHQRVPLTTPSQADGDRVASSNLSAASPSIPRRIHRGRGRTPLIIGGIVAAAALGVGVPVLWPSDAPGLLGARGVPAARPAAAVISEPRPTASEPRPAPASEPTRATTSEPKPALVPAGPSSVTIEIRVSPETAELSIDDRLVGRNPYVGQFVADSAVHHIRASAAGYVAKSFAVSFDTNLSLDLSLERLAPQGPHVTMTSRPSRPPRAPERRPTPPARPPPAPAVVAAPPRVEPPRPEAPEAPQLVEPRPPRPVEVDPAGGTRPRRPIDPTNPYGGSR
jgi:eukaryotic-like serine/threonine-protein kinase